MAFGNTTRALLVVLAVAVGLPPCPASGDAPRDVGAILALSGPLSVQGVPFRNAMVMAEEELDKENRIRLHFEDDGFLPRNTVTAAQNLIERMKAGVLVVFGTAQGLAVVEMTERKRIPLLSINVNRSVVKNRQYALLLMPSVETLTERTIEEAKRRGYKRVATAASIQDSCLLQQRIFEESGIAAVVASQEFDPSEREFGGISAHMISSRPDAVFLSTLVPQGSLLAKRLRQLGFKGEFFGSIQTAYLSELKASEGALENAWVVSADDSHADLYYERYRRRFGSEPTDLSAYAYDSIKLIIEGMRDGDLNNFLHTVQGFEGMAGRYGADGNNGFTFGVRVKQFARDGYR